MGDGLNYDFKASDFFSSKDSEPQHPHLFFSLIYLFIGWVGLVKDLPPQYQVKRLPVTCKRCITAGSGSLENGYVHPYKMRLNVNDDIISTIVI